MVPSSSGSGACCSTLERICGAIKSCTRLTPTVKAAASTHIQSTLLQERQALPIIQQTFWKTL